MREFLEQANRGPVMETVGSSEAKTHLASLLARVAHGEKITITKHGVPVAMLVPVGAPGKRNAAIEPLGGPWRVQPNLGPSAD